MKLNKMESAPKDETEILAFFESGKSKYWIIVYYSNSVFDDYLWRTGGEQQYKESDLKGWLPLPEIEDEIEFN